ncbi:3,4-dihydroxy-2-butanone-4-phosphate synthase [Chitinimonas sp. BJB300]|uniref:3,4-dihydroxy-2-butanone-4-phosphate synthase n=1 Tax=Chitinimonas sp. BJB300 TaxID=1559339 RepID=UPI000C100643|nr:3,4-dihydroxy-2-butanone-4-phosphate synthase [Chitinimonas sp. BJB300]PHV11787.1 3,4-dihydroxy-2-butanone-4-phosphate synthase [Chitinimonas sp. BJB300]TSJ91213.1 3,4-dihydroxy-2-butanone-4-phosphate synthase [Chitinimonas sp. BJB300]
MSLFQQYFSSTSPESRVLAAIEAIRQGRGVVLLDDEERENEADLIFAAELICPANMAQLIRDCSGIVCLCLTDVAVTGLGLVPMVAQNDSLHGTAFTVSIEARHGVTTGVSAQDRVTTVRAALTAQPSAIVSPGHVFPLRAHPGGVLARRGHTEGTVELARMAGLQPAGLLCELTNADGTMMRGDAVIAYASQHGLPVATIEDLVQWRLSCEVRMEAELHA